MSIYFTVTLLILSIQYVVDPAATLEDDQSAAKPAGGNAANPNPAANTNDAANTNSAANTNDAPNTNDAANTNSAANTNDAANQKLAANLFVERLLKQFSKIDYSKIPPPINNLAREGIRHFKNGADNMEKNDAIRKPLDALIPPELRKQIRNTVDVVETKIEENKKKKTEHGASTSETANNGDDATKTATAGYLNAVKFLQHVATLDFTKTPTALNNLAFQGFQQFIKNADNWEKKDAIRKQLDALMPPEERKQIRKTMDEIEKKLEINTKKEKEQKKDTSNGETAENGDKTKKTAQEGGTSIPVQGSEDKKDGNGPKP